MMRNYKLTTFYISLNPLILLVYKEIFKKKLVFLLMIYRNTKMCTKPTTLKYLILLEILILFEKTLGFLLMVYIIIFFHANFLRNF